MQDVLIRLELLAAWLKPGGTTPAEPIPKKYSTLVEAIDEIKRLRETINVSHDMVDLALNAWFASPPSETDQGLERSMRAALEAVLKR